MQPSRPSPSQERAGLGILATHGFADATTTAAAAAVVGPHAEGNPLIAALLAEGIGFAVGTMLLVVGLVAVAYPWVAAWAGLPRWFATALIVVGVLVALGNIAVVLGVVA